MRRLLVILTLLALLSTSGAAVVAQEEPAASGAFEPAGALAEARELHATTLLPDGAANTDPNPAVAAAGSELAFPTPEDAVRECLAGVADADVHRILAATAMDEMSEGGRFDLVVERLNSYSPHIGLAPAEYPFFVDITRAKQVSNILSQVQMLAYSLLSDDPIEDSIGGDEMEPSPRAWAQGFIEDVDPDRLADLTIEQIMPADADREDSDAYRRITARQTASVGADEQTERLAIPSLSKASCTSLDLRYSDTATAGRSSAKTHSSEGPSSPGSRWRTPSRTRRVAIDGGATLGCGVQPCPHQNRHD